MILLKRLSFFLILVLGGSLVTAMEEDIALQELAQRIVYDIKHSDQFAETLHAIKNNVEVLDPSQANIHILSAITTAYEACDDTTDKPDKLLDLFKTVLEIGKGHGFFDELIKTIDFKKAPYQIVQAIKGTYPDLFPEEEKEDSLVEEESSEESVEEEEFIFTQPSYEAAKKAFSFQRFVYTLNKKDPIEMELEFFIKDLKLEEFIETDLSGKSMGCYLLKKMSLGSGTGYRYIKHFTKYLKLHNKWANARTKFINLEVQRVKEINKSLKAKQKQFKAGIYCGSSSFENDDASNNFDTLQALLYNFSVEQKLVEEINKERARLGLDPLLQQDSRECEKPQFSLKAMHEKICAHHSAELFMAVEFGDDGLSNACEMIKERPYLVNAQDLYGVPILYKVLRIAEEYPDKRNGLKAFFNLLLLLGADPDCSVLYKPVAKYYAAILRLGGYEYPVRSWVDVKQEMPLPTVRLILTGDEGDHIFCSSDGVKRHSLGGGLAPKMSISQDSADMFNQCLDAFEENPEAPFRQYPALRQYMPVKEAPVKKLPKTKFDKEAMDKYLNLLDEDAQKEKSFFETYKPTFKSLLWGAVIGGFSYWLCNREDRHEARRRMRARASR